ncbi:hypothetical protein [Rhodococcus sp. Leaf233]|uniref:hypothetical protein n=1 Tax=Rhodococcus sp. Leaf233 TaxID=1736302 RepID=UPI00070C2E08|nr:hypothetical protein [Rhodococcus sp. Leaf233]KQU33531.1 hypothetical protein ASH04_06755 [Rhodococcus sp. Leaf233]
MTYQPDPDGMNSLYRETLTIWGETCSLQVRGQAGLVLHHPDDAPRSREDLHPYEIPVADAVLIRDVLNAATDRGELPSEITPYEPVQP